MYRDLIQALEGIEAGRRNDPTSLTPVGPYAHGQGGLFSQAGVDNAVFSAFMLPGPGLIDVIPVYNAGVDDSGTGPNFGGNDAEFFSTITGVTEGALETFANQPTAKCADGARAGLMKVCTLVSGFGNYKFSPNGPVSIFDAGRRRDIADPLTLRLMNSPMMNQFGVPSAAGVASETNWLLNELSKRIMEMSASISRFMAKRVYIGNPANNNGEARDIYGLDLQIAKGNKIDAYTSSICKAMDSEIYDFGYDLVTGAGRDIQKYAESMIAILDWKSSHQGLGDTWDGVISMRAEAWDEIAKTISVRQIGDAIAQAKLLNGSVATVTVNIDGRQTVEMRDKLTTGKMWPLRGRYIKVVTDGAITESTPNQTTKLIAGQYASDIYFVPLRVLGTIPVTYWKYFNHANLNSESLARLVAATTFTTDAGMFRWYINAKNGCVDWTDQFTPRLILRTPQLAGRIQNVAYQPLQHFADWDTRSDYFVNGGRTTSPTTSFYAPWAGSSPTNIPM